MQSVNADSVCMTYRTISSKIRRRVKGDSGVDDDYTSEMHAGFRSEMCFVMEMFV